MTDRAKRRVERLEARHAPRLRIVVTYPGDPWPENLSAGACHFVVEYVEPPEVEVG